MNHKQKYFYTALGAFIMLTGMGVGAIVSPPLIAQRGACGVRFNAPGLRWSICRARLRLSYAPMKRWAMGLSSTIRRACLRFSLSPMKQETVSP